LVDLKKKSKKDQTSNTQNLKKFEQQVNDHSKELNKVINHKDAIESDLKQTRVELGKLSIEYESLKQSFDMMQGYM
jgi:hypothetical protein